MSGIRRVWISLYVMVFGVAFIQKTEFFLIIFEEEGELSTALLLYPISSIAICVCLAAFLKSKSKAVFFGATLSYITYALLDITETYYWPLLSKDEYKMLLMIYVVGLLALVICAKKEMKNNKKQAKKACGDYS